MDETARSVCVPVRVKPPPRGPRVPLSSRSPVEAARRGDRWKGGIKRASGKRKRRVHVYERARARARRK